MRLSRPSCTRSLITAGITAALCVTTLPAFAAADHSHAPAAAAVTAPNATAAEARQKGYDHTQALMALQKQWANAKGADKSRALEQLVTKAEERRAYLLELMESNPAEVLRVAIPAEQQAGMPAEVLEKLEQTLDAEGELESVYEDYKDGSHKLRQFLKTPFGERLELHFAGKGHNTAKGGTKVRISGLFLESNDTDSDGNFALASEDDILTLELGGDTTGGSNGGTPAPMAHTLGEQNTLVILVNFQDKAEQPYTTEHARQVIFGETSDYFLESSYGQTWLNGDVTGWYTIPMESTVCDGNSLKSHANEAATAAGFDIASYDRLVYAFPQNACSFWGSASVGNVPSSTMINGDLSLEVTGHEMGHNFGSLHSHALVCSDGSSVGAGGVDVLGATPWSNCTNVEYGDGLDIMGWSPAAHANAAQKERLGWLNYQQSPPLTTVSQSGVYTIAPYAAQDGSSKALKILKSPADQYGFKTWYYVEYRQAVGYDAVLNSVENMMDSDNVLNGVTVHVSYEGNGGNNIYLLDMTPETSSGLYTRDPALTTGASFTDPSAGVTITTEWADAAGATVNISFDDQSQSCVLASPSVNVTPGQSPWLTAGSSYTYNVDVTNNDSSACGNNSFTLAANTPAGWDASLGGTSLDLAPGETGSTSITVNSASSATDGFYEFNVSAESGNYRAVASSTLIIDTPVSNNSAPVAVDDLVTITSESPVTIQILDNDWDPENDRLQLQSVNQGSKGTVKVNADGSVTYTPAKSFKSSDSFSYTITDGEKTAQARVAIELKSASSGSNNGGGKGRNK